MPFDNQSPLMKRLAEIAPKELKEEPKPHSFSSLQLKVHPIRMSAEAFTHWLEGELPANEQEMIAVLWMFGEILNGHMERALNDAYGIAQQLDDLRPAPTIVVENKDDKQA